MLEKDFWTKVRKAIGGKWKSERVENKLSADFPDVVYSIYVCGVVRNGLLELKCGKPNKNGTLTIGHYTEGQRDFAKNHGAYLLVYVEDVGVMLFGNNFAKELFKGQTILWHIERSVYFSKTLNGDELFMAFRTILFPDYQF